MYLYDFIETLTGLKLDTSKLVLNSTKDDFDPTNRLRLLLDSKLSDESYAETVAWNGNRVQQFKPGQIIVQLVKLAQQKYVLGSIARVLEAKENDGPNRDVNRYLYKLEKISGPIADFYGSLFVSSTYKANMAYQLKFPRVKDQFNVGNNPIIDEFPGYDKVNVTFSDLSNLIDTSSWQAALKNLKGVYMLRDNNNGKQYVGSAYGKEMLWQRWKSYITTGHGGDKMLIPLGKDYIAKNFSFIILATFLESTSDKEIINCESEWKEKLGTRVFGYNAN